MTVRKLIEQLHPYSLDAEVKILLEVTDSLKDGKNWFSWNLSTGCVIGHNEPIITVDAEVTIKDRVYATEVTE